MDVESLQKSGRRRGSCVDACLVASIIFLFVAVTAVAAAGVLAVMDLQSKIKHSSPTIQYGTSQLTGHAPDPVYKMQNFAYLEAKSNALKNFTMHWNPIHYSTGGSVGSNFLFNSEEHSLKPEQSGTYFMYIELNFTCTYRCHAGLLSVQVGDKLTCQVHLPEVTNSTHFSKKCWTVSHMGGQRLVAHMTVPKDALENWRLEMNSSGFGMFLVG